MASQRASGYRVDNTLPGPTGRSPLREHTYARPANAASFGDYVGHQEIGDVVLAENERIVCVERLTTQTIEQPIVVHEERLQEKTVLVPKQVQRTTTTERPVIQPLRKPIQIIREVPVERVIEKAYTRKVYIERIIEQVVEVYKDVPVERCIERVVEVVKEVPVEKVVERIQLKEIPVVETEERVVEVVREIPVEIVKEVPVYIKVDPTEWDSRHSIRSSAAVSGVQPSGSYNTNSITRVEGQAVSRNSGDSGIGGVGMRLAWYEQTGGRIYVCEIVSASPASESGEVRVGDILLSVDGQRVQGMQLENVNRLISGAVGSTVNLELQHEDGSTSRLSLQRRSVYRR